MLVLVACEESQRVCISFREKGHEAFSCDLIDCSGGHPEWHIKGDCLDLINGHCRFTTCDGVSHFVPKSWDLIIAHPPCTYLCRSGFHYCDTRIYGEMARQRQKLRLEAFEFFKMIYNAECPRICVENPVGYVNWFIYPSQIYNPYNFGDETDAKSTCLWLKGLPILKWDKDLKPELQTHSIRTAIFNGVVYKWGDPELSRLRSQTPWGVARAMANQWG